MLELQNIRAGYAGREVLHSVSVRFETGRVTALIGPNGCGKTTLLKICARLLAPQAGRVLVDGADARRFSPKAFARMVSFLPQGRDVPSIAVRTLVAHARFPYQGFGRVPSPKDREAVHRAMEDTGVMPFAEKSLASLSGGERQKVYLAMAAAQETPVMLLDEPTTFLDIAHQLEIMRLVKNLKARGRTVVMVLHDISQALTHADCVIVLQGGAIAAQGLPEAIYESRAVDAAFGVTAERLWGEDGAAHYVFHER